MDQTPSPRDSNKLSDLIIRYGERWLPETVKIFKRIQLAIIIFAITFAILALGILGLLAYWVIGK